MIVRIDSLQNDMGTGAGDLLSTPLRSLSIGVFCDASMGFPSLLRVGVCESESPRWYDAALLTDQDGDTVLRIELPRSKPSQ